MIKLDATATQDFRQVLQLQDALAVATQMAMQLGFTALALVLQMTVNEFNATGFDNLKGVTFENWTAEELAEANANGSTSATYAGDVTELDAEDPQDAGATVN
jgi:hypothetical protein